MKDKTKELDEKNKRHRAAKLRKALLKSNKIVAARDKANKARRELAMARKRKTEGLS